LKTLKPHSFYIETFGCQMNEQDSLRTAVHLSQAGYREISSAREADILIINTCSIRRKAEEKVYSLLGRYRTLKRKNPNLIIAVGGCVAQQEGGALLDRMPHVDFVFGPHHVYEIDHLISRFVVLKERFAVTAQAGDSTEDLECPGIPDQSGLKAYMTIMEGCNNFCSFCIVPYLRGRERSRSSHALCEEAHALIKKGVKEITLLGQNVNAYRNPDNKDFGFADLLKDLCKISGLQRLRFTTSHPKNLSTDLIDCFGELKPLCEHIHLPLQSGSDKILSAMNRKYTVAQYLEKITALRRRSPEISITSDMIVGFPGESTDDFLETMEIIKQVEFDNLFSFKFSARAGTKAANLEDTVSEEEKKDRLQALQTLQKRITLGKNKQLKGRRVQVLVEGKNRDDSQWTGRTRSNRIVNFTGFKGSPGQLIDVYIQKGCYNSLVGISEQKE